MQRDLKVHVDPSVCIGNGMCREVAPRNFKEVDGGQSTGVSGPTDEAEAILEAAEICPVGAITVHDAETGERLFP